MWSKQAEGVVKSQEVNLSLVSESKELSPLKSLKLKKKKTMSFSEYAQFPGYSSISTSMIRYTVTHFLPAPPRMRY